MPTIAGGPDAIVGRAVMGLQAQRITQAQFQDILERANMMRIAPRPERSDENRCYF